MRIGKCLLAFGIISIFLAGCCEKSDNALVNQAAIPEVTSTEITHNKNFTRHGYANYKLLAYIERIDEHNEPIADTTEIQEIGIMSEEAISIELGDKTVEFKVIDYGMEGLILEILPKVCILDSNYVKSSPTEKIEFQEYVTLIPEGIEGYSLYLSYEYVIEEESY